MKKRLLAFVLAAVLCFPAVNCGGKEEERGAVTEHALNLPQATEYAEDYRAFPRAEGETQKVIDYVDLSGCSWYEFFFASALQGFVNRKDPCVYLIREGSIVQDSGAAASFWLEKLDESYGEGVYTKNRIASLKALLLKYRESVSGAVLYHERLLASGTQLVNQSAGSTIYGDMAVAHYTTMLCAQKTALPVTQSLLDEMNAFLAENGAEPLEVVGDTRDFLKDSEGALISDTGSREVWYKVYRTALDNVKNGDWRISELALAHNGTWNGAWFDYIFQHKLFAYNRIINDDATAEERAIEQEIMNLTPKNTALMGVWHLVAGFDEPAVIQLCDQNDKFFTVTFGTYNLSWSCGLPRTPFEEDTEKLTYDPEKVYLSFCLSETDNNTYTYYYLKDIYESDLRGSFAMTWQMNQANFDLNPNIIKYMNATFTENDSFAYGEAGIGYVRDLAQRSDFNGFLGLTDKYSADMNAQGGINTMYCKVPDAMTYIEATDNIKSMTLGYMYSAEAADRANSGLTYYYHDTPIFMNLGYEGAPTSLLDLSLDGGSFVNVRLSGFQPDALEKINGVIGQFPENYEVVTQTQLIDLYRQKMSAVCEDVNQVSFDCSMNETESAFLWYSDDKTKYSQAIVDGQEEYRYGTNENELVYRFRLDPESESAVFDLAMSGEYAVEFSVDQLHWTRAARYLIEEGDKSYSTRRPVRAVLPEEMAGKTVYLRISDPTPEDGIGYRIYGVSMTTDLGGVDSALNLEAGYDTAYVESGTLTESGRTGETVYRIPFSASVNRAVLTAEADGAATIEMSANGTKFYPLEVNTFDRSASGMSSYYYADMDSIAGTMYLRVKTEAALKSLRILPLATRDGFVFSPCGSETDMQNYVYGGEVKRTRAGSSSNARVSYADGLCYAFRIGSGISDTPILTVYAAGMFQLEVSNNGRDWGTLKSVAAGENVSEELRFDVMSYVKPGNILYIRFTKSMDAGANAALYYMSLN